MTPRASGARIWTPKIIGRNYCASNAIRFVSQFLHGQRRGRGNQRSARRAEITAIAIAGAKHKEPNKAAGFERVDISRAKSISTMPAKFLTMKEKVLNCVEGEAK